MSEKDGDQICVVGSNVVCVSFVINILQCFGRVV